MGKAPADVLFTWYRPGTPGNPRGYEWKRKGSWKGRQYLVPLLGAKSEWTEYTPHPGLFRVFADIPTTKDDLREREIRAFAKGSGDIIAKPKDEPAAMGTWCRTIQHMHRAVDLWDRINAPEKHWELEELFTRPKGAILYWQMHHHLELSPDKKTRPAQREGEVGGVVTTCPAIVTGKDVTKYPVGEVIPLARKALQYEIQSAFIDTETPSHTTPCIVTPDFWLALRPTNLLAFMWLSFARVVTGEIEERRCEMFKSCQSYIYIGPGLQRNDATTCSAACRQEKKRAAQKTQ